MNQDEPKPNGSREAVYSGGCLSKKELARALTELKWFLDEWGIVISSDEGETVSVFIEDIKLTTTEINRHLKFNKAVTDCPIGNIPSNMPVDIPPEYMNEGTEEDPITEDIREELACISDKLGDIAQMLRRTS